MMRKTACLFISVVFFNGCTARMISNYQAHQNNQRVKRENVNNSAPQHTSTAAEYIDRFKGIAIQEMNLNGIPASITLAQGLFESGTGNSELARVANNHFGIKANADWPGQVYY